MLINVPTSHSCLSDPLQGIWSRHLVWCTFVLKMKDCRLCSYYLDRHEINMLKHVACFPSPQDLAMRSLNSGIL